MRFVKGFLHFWYDFIVGDDWRIAAGVVVLIVLGALGAAAEVSSHLIVVLIAVAVIALTFGSIVQEARLRRPG